MRIAAIAAGLVLAVGGIVSVVRSGHEVAPRGPQALHALMSPQTVRAVLGSPDVVFRDTPRALCWSYGTPERIRLCFGARRRLAWWASSSPISCAKALVLDTYDGSIAHAYTVGCYRGALRTITDVTPGNARVYHLLVAALDAARARHGSLSDDLPVAPPRSAPTPRLA